MSEAYMNQITLDCLVNKEQYKRHLENAITKEVNRKDKKFYRKRIFNLAKDLLLTKNEPDNLLPDVKYAFDNFIKSCVHYFKILDNNDIIQEDYKGIDFSHMENFSELNIDDIKNKEEADKLLMRSINIPKSSLDNFVKIKMTKLEKEIPLPQQKDINLKDPILKNKGLGKKKNITNKYDEKNTKNEKNENDKKK